MQSIERLGARWELAAAERSIVWNSLVATIIRQHYEATVVMIKGAERASSPENHVSPANIASFPTSAKRRHADRTTRREAEGVATATAAASVVTASTRNTAYLAPRNLSQGNYTQLHESKQEFVRNEARIRPGRREVEAGEERDLRSVKTRRHTGRLPPRQCEKSTKQECTHRHQRMRLGFVSMKSKRDGEARGKLEGVYS